MVGIALIYTVSPTPFLFFLRTFAIISITVLGLYVTICIFTTAVSGMLSLKKYFMKQVECGESALSLVFKTSTPFMGRVYVRGLADDERCFRSFADNLEQTAFSILIQIGDCAMQKQRIRGSLEVTLSFF